MLVFRHVFPVVVALVLAGIMPGAGQAAFPSVPETPKPAVMPGQNPAATSSVRQAPSSISTLQTKTAPRTPTAFNPGPSSSSSRTVTGAPATTSSSTGNAVRIVRLYRGPGRFDEKLASQLKLALQKAFGTEPDAKSQPGNGPVSPAGPDAGQGKIAQNTTKVN